jgi:hypothetical protein
MHKSLVVDRRFFYLIDRKSTSVVPVARISCEPQISEWITELAPVPNGPLFNDYLSLSPWMDEYRRLIKDFPKRTWFEAREHMLRDQLLQLVTQQSDTLEKTELRPTDLTAQSLVNLLECFCWVHGGYAVSCHILGENVYQYSLYKKNKLGFFGTNIGDLIFSFRLDDVLKLRVASHSGVTQLVTRVGVLKGVYKKGYPILDDIMVQPFDPIFLEKNS